MQTNKTSSIASFCEKTVDHDGDFPYRQVEWDGPAGYTIVVPANHAEEKKLAARLNAFFQKQAGLSLPISEDSAAETEKEILIGNTARRDENTILSAGELSVSLQENKLVFAGGHSVTLQAAVDKFIRLKPQVGSVAVFDLKTDFKAVLPGGYEYVWGDEFEGDDIDLSKWDFDRCMCGTEMIEVAYDKDVIRVSDGRLKLYAIEYTDPQKEKTRFKVPYSVMTRDKMNYVYGYVEIRAKLPFFRGSWPSFWAQTTGSLSGKDNDKYMTEVDVFEAFGYPMIYFNLHKWYLKDFDFDAVYGLNKNRHTMYNEDAYKRVNTDYRFENTENLENEYHTYGFEWTPTTMSGSIDGKVFATLDITKSYDECEDYAGFHSPIFLMFNNHLMAPDSDFRATCIADDLDKLPACYYIDYIRLYQKPGVGELYLNDEIREYPLRK